MGRQRTFYRRAGAVAIRPRTGETIEKLTGAGGAFAGFTEVRTWPGGVSVLQAPEAEVARQVVEPGRARTWLEEVRAAGGAHMANPVLIEPESGLMMIPFGEIIVRLKEGVDAARYFGGGLWAGAAAAGDDGPICRRAEDERFRRDRGGDRAARGTCGGGVGGAEFHLRSAPELHPERSALLRPVAPRRRYFGRHRLQSRRHSRRDGVGHDARRAGHRGRGDRRCL